MKMRVLIGALLACTALLAEAQAQSGYYGLRDVGGYDGVVCSSFVNNATTGGYRLLTVPTGYKQFRMLRIIPYAPGAAQTCAVRFWPSTTDSTGGIATVAWAITVDGEPYNQYFPINCKCISVSLIADTDDFRVEAYYTVK